MTKTITPRTADLDNTSVLGDASESLRLFEHTLLEAMELEFEQHVGAGRYERNGERLDHRNGTRRRRFDTTTVRIRDGRGPRAGAVSVGRAHDS